jgi:hypothetical protein
MKYNSGQGAIEYLLIIAAAILVVAIVILAVTGALEGGQEQTTFSNISVQKSYSELQINLNYQKTGLYFGSEITPNEESVLENGLIGLFHFNNSPATSANIVIPVIAPNGSPYYAPGLWSTNGLIFATLEDRFFELETSSIGAYPQQITYSVWFKPTELNNNYIFSMVHDLDDYGSEPDNFNHSRGFAKVTSTGTVGFDHATYSPDPGCWEKWVGLETSDIVILNQRNHFVATIDLDDDHRTRIYLNGKYQMEDDETSGTNCVNDTRYIWVGRRKGHPGIGNENFVGSIEEFAIWDRIFSEEEVKNLFDKGAAYIE